MFLILSKKVWALQQLLRYMKHSPFLSCKRAASTIMGSLFDELPDMQELATDVVYDLCEDSEQHVS